MCVCENIICEDMQINPSTSSLLITRPRSASPPRPRTPPHIRHIQTHTHGSVTYADEHLREGSAGILGHVDGWNHPVPLLPPQTFGTVPAGAGEQDDRRRRRERLLQLPSLGNFVLFLCDL